MYMLQIMTAREATFSKRLNRFIQYKYGAAQAQTPQ